MKCPNFCSTLQETAGASSLEAMDNQPAVALGSGVEKILCIPVKVPWKNDIPAVLQAAAVVAASVGTSSVRMTSLRHWKGMRTRLADKK